MKALACVPSQRAVSLMRGNFLSSLHFHPFGSSSDLGRARTVTLKQSDFESGGQAGGTSREKPVMWELTLACSASLGK